MQGVLVGGDSNVNIIVPFVVMIGFNDNDIFATIICGLI
jgi:hypothetical protein